MARLAPGTDDCADFAFHRLSNVNWEVYEVTYADVQIGFVSRLPGNTWLAYCLEGRLGGKFPFREDAAHALHNEWLGARHLARRRDTGA